jgi:hypothetical protein
MLQFPKTEVPLQCPGGNPGTRVVLAAGFTTPFGIGHPENIGDCPLSIAGVDEQGNVIGDPVDHLVLQPGENNTWYFPPPGTAKIVAECFTDCSGAAVLRYDLPIA